MPICHSKYWGDIEYADESIVSFPRGLFGFDHERRFLLVEQAHLKPLVFLQSLNTRELCFLTMPALAILPPYKLKVAAEDLETIGLLDGAQPAIGTDVACLAIVRLKEEGGVTANLLAPVVISLKSRRGVQAIAPDSDYSHQFPVEAGAACSS